MLNLFNSSDDMHLSLVYTFLVHVHFVFILCINLSEVSSFEMWWRCYSFACIFPELPLFWIFWWPSLFVIFLASYVLNTVLAPLLGRQLNQQAAAEAEKVLISSLSTIENIWLKGNGRYLLGGLRPSIADLSLVCEIMQLEVNEGFPITK